MRGCKNRLSSTLEASEASRILLALSLYIHGWEDSVPKTVIASLAGMGDETEKIP
jgi:hypothetical protein